LPPLQPRSEGSGARGCGGRARGFSWRTMWFNAKTSRSSPKTFRSNARTFRSNPNTIRFNAKTSRSNPKTIRSNAKTFRSNRWNNAPHAQRWRVDGDDGPISGADVRCERDGPRGSSVTIATISPIFPVVTKVTLRARRCTLRRDRGACAPLCVPRHRSLDGQTFRCAANTPPHPRSRRK